ncbi:helix-turn-helix domain-containing protein [Mycobacterium sp. NPDC050853]
MGVTPEPRSRHATLRSRLNNNEPPTTLAREYGISRQTVYNYKTQPA